ncbi:STAS domain-containing protein [Streptomyces sp. G-G2]|uniref:STAS domain-containing protein n=1 Tax=Streptomyces sp. G-G2 TaxID=3046201 RepID=UPI0024B9E177|nr:STAS domain-containing protein [Streptomyces sp. G-G2]MDJ0385606.1 hypothetical protein [Streptomyces sp. G-G2]
MLPVKVTDRGVLIIGVRADLDIADRAAAAWAIDGVLNAHRSSPVVLELSDAVVSPAAVSTVVRAHRRCRDAGVALAVVASRTEARRTLAVATGAQALDVHTALPLAVTALSAPAGAAA